MNTKELIVGNVYIIHHARKGVFTGQLIAIEDWDEIDPQVLTFKYDVRGGTDQARLAVTPGKDKVRVSNLRPSLILKLEEEDSNHWLREVKVEEEQSSGLIDRIFKRSN